LMQNNGLGLALTLFRLCTSCSPTQKELLTLLHNCLKQQSWFDTYHTIKMMLNR